MTSPPDNLVDLRDVRFGYGARPVLNELTLAVPRGKVTALMGASGGGKTTVLRLIGGQVRAQASQCRAEISLRVLPGIVRPEHGDQRRAAVRDLGRQRHIGEECADLVERKREELCAIPRNLQAAQHPQLVISHCPQESCERTE